MQTVKHFAAAAVKQEHNNVKVFLPCSIINGKVANCFGLKDCLIFSIAPHFNLEYSGLGSEKLQFSVDLYLQWDSL